MTKLLLVGSNTIHVYNYLRLVESFFDEILLISNEKNTNYDYTTIVADFSLKKPLNYLRTPRTIRKAIESFKPDVIHIHQANSYAYYTFRAVSSHNIPVVLTAWGSDILIVPSLGRRLRNMVVSNISKADAITSDSGFMADEIRRLCPDYKGELLIANFGIGIEAEDRLKEKLIYSNRLHKPLYRIDRIISAFHAFHKTDAGADWKLVVAATGTETEKLQRLVAELRLQDKVEFAGWVDKVKNAGFYSRARLFVSIPESDATSISLLEAMACGCVPIVSDLPANREWVQDGINGIIVNDTNSDFLSRALSMDVDAASAMNKEIVSRKGTKEVNKALFLKLYETLLK